jgi:hypothetical protein
VKLNGLLDKCLTWIKKRLVSTWRLPEQSLE